jgi:hypothetical protein
MYKIFCIFLLCSGLKEKKMFARLLCCLYKESCLGLILTVLVIVLVAVEILAVIALTAPVIILLLLQWQCWNVIGGAGGDFVRKWYRWLQ